jgi:hypothetical protein
MIPDELSAQDVFRAIDIIDREGVPRHRRSHKHCLRQNGRDYPSKYVVSLACRGILGRDLESYVFNGGESETNERLRRLGFSVVACSCGGG